MTNQINNEKFLLALLDMTDCVYVGGVDEYLYFYPTNPKSLGFSIKIPFSQGSTSVDVNFTFDSPSRRESEERFVNFSFNSPDEIQDFMKQLYQKHENLLNSHVSFSPETLEVIDKFEKILKSPLDNYPYILQGVEEEMKIKDRHTDDGVHISFGRTLFNYEDKRKFKSLEPIIIDCFYRESLTSPNIMYKKVIPAYMAHEYPIVEKHAYIHKSTKNLHELTDALYKIHPDSAIAISALLLDVELDKKTPIKNSRPKL